MPISNPLPEFAQEMQVTRRVLERVPTEQGEWRPHPKSFPLGHLAQLVAGMPGWIPMVLQHPRLDLADSPGYTFEPTEKLLAQFDANVAEAAKALAGIPSGQLDEPWSLVHGDRVLMTQPKGEVIRSHMHHMVHHRAQLGVYLRLLDLPVPCMYGPTADEPW